MIDLFEHIARSNLQQNETLMKHLKSPFFAYRYLVTPINNQSTIIQAANKSKEELMKDLVAELNTNTKTEWHKGTKRYLIYGFQNRNDIYILKYARITNEKIYKEGESDIEIEGIKSAKFVFLIIDVKYQIILIERNSSVFSSIRTAINTLSNYFREKMREFDYVVNMYPLVSKRSFWNYVEEADKIFELHLVLNAPNMPFLGNSDTRDVLEKIKETTNNEEFEIGFRNKEGGLTIIKESLGNWINYIQEVGGKYWIKFKKDGVDELKSSYDDTAKTRIPKKKTEQYTDEELTNIEDKTKLMHNLETRTENDEDES